MPVPGLGLRGNGLAQYTATMSATDEEIRTLFQSKTGHADAAESRDFTAFGKGAGGVFVLIFVGAQILLLFASVYHFFLSRVLSEPRRTAWPSETLRRRQGVEYHLFEVGKNGAHCAAPRHQQVQWYDQ